MIEPLSDNPEPAGWTPMTDQQDRKTIGKLIEELGECVAAAARCDIQGMDGVNPKNGQINRYWLEDEIGDVLANIALTIERFNLNQEAIQERCEVKHAMLSKWHHEL